MPISQSPLSLSLDLYLYLSVYLTFTRSLDFSRYSVGPRRVVVRRLHSHAPRQVDDPAAGHRRAVPLALVDGRRVVVPEGEQLLLLYLIF